MSNTDFPGREVGNRSEGRREGAASHISSLAQETVGAATRVASNTAATLMDEVRELANHQIRSGADNLGYVARSMRQAAGDLERDVPQLAGVVRSLATKTDNYADVIRHQSIEQLWGAAADATRRKPALVFGLAALGGFFMLRMVRNTPPNAPAAPSIQQGEFGRTSNLHV